MNDPQPIHATLVARFVDGAWRGALLRGPSGVGKSDLALRLLEQGWRLVADDRVLIWRAGGRLWGRAPTVLHGRLEVRGIGVLSFPALDLVEIVAVVDCLKSTEAMERIPSRAVESLCGVRTPVHRLHPLEASAVTKVMTLCGVLGV